MRNHSRPDTLSINLPSANGGTTRRSYSTRASSTSEQLGQCLGILNPEKLMVQLADADRRHIAYSLLKRDKASTNLLDAKKGAALFQQHKY